VNELEEPPASLSPREVLEKQQRMYEEFNGPCVVCLEPDADSKARLVELRDLLRRELFGNRSDFVDRYSPTATVAGPSSRSVFLRANPEGAEQRRGRQAPPAPPASRCTDDPIPPAALLGHSRGEGTSRRRRQQQQQPPTTTGRWSRSGRSPP
jgi:hypothetical protein